MYGGVGCVVVGGYEVCVLLWGVLLVVGVGCCCNLQMNGFYRKMVNFSSSHGKRREG